MERLACFHQSSGRTNRTGRRIRRQPAFPFYDRLEADCTMAPALAQFCEHGTPPIIFTLGSSAVMDPGDFYHVSVEAAMKLGCRAVLLTGAFGNSRLRGALPPNIFLGDYAPFSELFPRASVIVHQGGVGTNRAGNSRRCPNAGDSVHARSTRQCLPGETAWYRADHKPRSLYGGRGGDQSSSPIGKP